MHKLIDNESEGGGGGREVTIAMRGATELAK